MLNTKAKADRLSSAVVLLSLLAIGVGWFLLYWHIHVVQDTLLARARELAASQSRILCEHAEQVLISTGTALRSFDGDTGSVGIQPSGDRLANHLLLRRLRESSPVFEGIGLVDQNGNVWASADHDPPGQVNLADRDYFVFHRDNAASQLLIGAPLVTRPNNAWTIPVSLRLEDDKGVFLGVVAARVRPQPFEQLYASVGADQVVLFKIDGTVLAASRGNETERIEGATIDRNELIRSDRIVAISEAASFPIAIAVGYDIGQVLAGARQDHARLTMIAIGSTAMIVVLTLFLVRLVQVQRRLRSELETAVIDAETANRTKSSFLAHMSHELRTPLNAIIGFSEMMSSQMLGPLANTKYLEYAELIRKSGTHLLAIINNILDLAKVDAGRWTVEIQPVRLSEIGTDLRHFTQVRARDLGVSLTVDLADDLPAVVTDRRILLQVLLNLTINAVKFTPRGGSVTVNGQVDSSGAKLVVADTGIGMTAEDLVRVLSPFGSATSELARRHQDTGLGLSLSKRFVELLGGSLTIDSAPGQGTRVTIVLPARPPAADPGDSAPPTAPDSGAMGAVHPA